MWSCEQERGNGQTRDGRQEKGTNERLELKRGVGLGGVGDLEDGGESGLGEGERVGEREEGREGGGDVGGGGED